MKIFNTHSIIMSAMIIMISNTTVAENIVVPNTFESGTAAVAEEVNENFKTLMDEANRKDFRLAALEAAVADLQSNSQAQAATIETLQSTVASLRDQIASFQSDLALQTSDLAVVSGNPVLNLEPHIKVTSDERGPLIIITGANLQIVNGQDQGGTETINGLGNLIIGYDEENSVNNTNFQYCSDGQFKNQEICESNGASWSNSHKSGSHNIVLGSENSYSSFGGLVAGKRNFITNEYASVLSGFGNAASGPQSGVLGGGLNEASSERSTISGGSQNLAGQFDTSIGGGIGVLLDQGYQFGSWAAGSLVEEP
jgi:uncharacterized coiled-coil protein SlyX